MGRHLRWQLILPYLKDFKKVEGREYVNEDSGFYVCDGTGQLPKK